MRLGKEIQTNSRILFHKMVFAAPGLPTLKIIFMRRSFVFAAGTIRMTLGRIEEIVQ
jgi:hypothetical protein